MQMELPPEVQKDIINYQALQNQLGVLQAQLARIEADLNTISDAIAALEATEDEFAYKAVGPILVRERKDVLLKELQEKKEALEVQKTSYSKKMKQLEAKLLELKKKIEQALGALQQGGGAGPTPSA